MNIIYDAFRFHSEVGLPLEVQVDYAKINGMEVNLAAFACDALGAGWKEEKVRKILETARPDLNWAEFRNKLAMLWALTGKLKDPEAWAAMKQRIVDHGTKEATVLTK